MDTTSGVDSLQLLTSTFDTRSGAIAEAQRRHTDAEPQLVWHLVFTDAYVVLARSERPTFRTDGVVLSTETTEQREAARRAYDVARRERQHWDEVLRNAQEAIAHAEEQVRAARRRFDEYAASHAAAAADYEAAATAAGEY